jgi:hypothetical protein
MRVWSALSSGEFDAGAVRVTRERRIVPSCSTWIKYKVWGEVATGTAASGAAVSGMFCIAIGVLSSIIEALDALDSTTLDDPASAASAPDVFCTENTGKTASPFVDVVVYSGTTAAACSLLKNHEGNGALRIVVLIRSLFTIKRMIIIRAKTTQNKSAPIGIRGLGSLLRFLARSL